MPPPVDLELKAIERANALLDLNRTAEVLRVLAPVLAGPTKRPEALQLAALAHLRRQELKPAQELLARLLSGWPDRAHGHYLMGFFHRRANQDRIAEGPFKEALRIEPEEPVYLRALAELYADLGRHELAATLAAQAVAVDPQRATNHLTMGYVASTAGRKADARRAYERALELDPTEAMVWNNLGCLDVAAGQSLTARQRFREALRLDPRGERAVKNMALVAPPPVEVFDFRRAVGLLMTELKLAKAPLSLCLAIAARHPAAFTAGLTTPKMTVTRALLGVGAVRALAVGAWWLPVGASALGGLALHRAVKGKQTVVDHELARLAADHAALRQRWLDREIEREIFLERAALLVEETAVRLLSSTKGPSE